MQSTPPPNDSGYTNPHFNPSSEAKHVVEIAALGLAANYMTKAHGQDVARHSDMQGGLTPRLASTGDRKHDAVLEAGRLSANLGAAWVIVHFIWPVYALGTAAFMGVCFGFHTPHILIPVIIWGIFQILFLLGCGRLFDGKRVKRAKHTVEQPKPWIHEVMNAPMTPSPVTPPIPTSVVTTTPGTTATLYNMWSEPIPVVLHPQKGYWVDAWGRPFSPQLRPIA